jgi:secreted PhoX family phosphatase
MSDIWSRRDFLEFFGKTLVGAAAVSLLPDCATHKAAVNAQLPFAPVVPSTSDSIRLADGLTHQVVIKWGDPISKTEKFGTHNDYLAFLPMSDKVTNEGLLWVNHEYVDPVLASGHIPGGPRQKKHMESERKEVGGSIVHIKRTDMGWQPMVGSSFNKRIDANTPIPIISDELIRGSSVAVGTLANCSGGVTPWKTILTCEENYQHFYGEAIFENGKRRVEEGNDEDNLRWLKFYDMPPEHFGWVVEVDPKTARAKKLTAMGRFSHESANNVVTPDGRCVVYTGDDRADEHIYKFIAAKPGSLEKGDLYVADVEKGKWLHLNRNSDPRLKKAFKSQTELLVRTREAAKIVGATPMNRPEDIEIDPRTHAIYVCLTNNKKRGDLFGSILKIQEANNDHTAMEFTSSTFATGGTKFGFACPDNMVFDPKGNLWMTCDVSGTSMNKGEYAPFGNNALFYFPMTGIYAGFPLRVATAPIGAEFTGPYFSPDGKTLFLSVQHPGEGSPDPQNPLSHWPDGGSSKPRSAVIAISGPALDRVMA